jgi:phage FluMu gp28-like protein
MASIDFRATDRRDAQRTFACMPFTGSAGYWPTATAPATQEKPAANQDSDTDEKE